MPLKRPLLMIHTLTATRGLYVGQSPLISLPTKPLGWLYPLVHIHVACKMPNNSVH